MRGCVLTRSRPSLPARVRKRCPKQLPKDTAPFRTGDPVAVRTGRESGSAAQLRGVQRGIGGRPRSRCVQQRRGVFAGAERVAPHSGRGSNLEIQPEVRQGGVGTAAESRGRRALSWGAVRSGAVLRARAKPGGTRATLRRFQGGGHSSASAEVIIAQEETGKCAAWEAGGRPGSSRTSTRLISRGAKARARQSCAPDR